MVWCRGNRKEAIVTQSIVWEGRFGAVPQEYAAQLQNTLVDFLKKGNLLYPKVTAIGFELFDRQLPSRLALLRAPIHCDFADMAIGATHCHHHAPLWGGMAVRVLWGCHGSYPLSMGTPSPKRLAAAVAEYNATGTVQTLEPPPGESLRYARNDAQDWFGAQLRRKREEARVLEEQALMRRVFGSRSKGWRPGLKQTLSGQVRRHGKTFGPSRSPGRDMAIYPDAPPTEATG